MCIVYDWAIVKISMLLYPQLTLLDLMGPLQVWNHWPDADIELVAASLDPVHSDSAATLLPTHCFETASDAPDILFVPGGMQGLLAAMADDTTLAYLAERGASAQWVTSVCTGSILLGAAGLLRGYRATTHWSVMSILPRFGASAERSRWVIDRNRATGGGVTAGIDFGLALLAELAGEQLARSVQLGIEYAPAPPFLSGTPDEAGAETLGQVSEVFEPLRQALLVSVGGAGRH